MISTPLVTCRSDLPKLIARSKARQPQIVELGVAKGDFTLELATKYRDMYITGIDRWSDHHDGSEYMQTMLRAKRFGNQVTLVRDTFENVAAKWRGTRLFDMVYIDGYAHTGQENGKTLDDWWPLCVSGGVFCGHDYDGEYPQTIDAVDKFCAKHKLPLVVLQDVSMERYASWYVIKQ